MLQLPHGFGLDLPHTFPRDLKNPAHFLEGIRVAVAQAIPQANDLPLAIGEGLEQTFDFGLEHGMRRRGQWALGALILDKLPEAAVLAFAHRAIEANRLPA